MELTMGTMVTIILLVMALILGIFLVQRIFTGAQYNINILDEKVRGEINKLFTEESRLVIYLANNIAEVEQGEDFGVAFGFKNLETGTVQTGSFTYDVIVSNPTEVQDKCGIDASVMEKWMTGKSETQGIPVAPGQVGYGLVRFEVPTTAPLCITRFRINVNKDGAAYSTGFFDLKITS